MLVLCLIQFIKLINGRNQIIKHQKSNILFFWWYTDIRNFHSNLLKIDKKSHKDIDIYYTGYIMIKKFSDYENSHSINPLYLIIHSATGHFKEKNSEKYLVIDSTEKYEEVFSGIIPETKTINGWKKLFYEKNYAKIGFDTDDDLLLNKQIKFPMLATIITYVFQDGTKLYPQIYLDECLYESVV